ncbi:hypothetical protein Tco_0413394 [Tanacetum coccineum]
MVQKHHYKSDLFRTSNQVVRVIESYKWYQELRFSTTKVLGVEVFDVKEQQGIDRFKQLGPGVETGIHGVHDEKRVWFEVELQGAQGDREAEVFQVSNDDTAVAQRWLIKVTRSPSSATGFKWPIDMLGFFYWLVSIKQGMLEPVKVKCIFLGYRKGVVGNKALKVLQGDEFEVEPQNDHTFEVEPHGNVDHVVGSQEVQTQDLIYYQLTRDREQHLACELYGYREDSNEAAFVVAAVEKLYAHESLTFNDTVACEVISKWKARLKDDMDTRSDVYVLSNGYKKCSDDNDGYY